MALASSAYADFINLNPGGWHDAAHGGAPPPSIFGVLDEEARNQVAFFDEARLDTPGGWVSLYGVLNGGLYFFTNLVNGAPLTTAIVSWNFATLPDYSMRYLNVFGFNNADPWEAVYQVTGNTVFNSDGWLSVTLDGNITITSISFYGTTPNTVVPDTGTTLFLFGFGLFALAALRGYTPAR